MARACYNATVVDFPRKFDDPPNKRNKLVTKVVVWKDWQAHPRLTSLGAWEPGVPGKKNLKKRGRSRLAEIASQK